MASLVVRDINLRGRSGIAAPGNFVHFGLSSLTMPLQGSAATKPPPPPPTAATQLNNSQETLFDGPPPQDTAFSFDEFLYNTFRGVHVSLNANGSTSIAILLSSSVAPGPEEDEQQEEEDLEGDGRSKNLLVIDFNTAELVKMQGEVPFVAAAVRAAGIALPSASTTTPGGEPDLSQHDHARKVSLYVYHHFVAVI